MKKLILIVLGLGAAGAFIGVDAVSAFVDKTRTSVRSSLMTPEMELQSQLASARELSEKCSESVVHGRVALARLDSMIQERDRELARRAKALDRDRAVLETRKGLLEENLTAYVISNERVSRRTLNRDALLRARAYATDKSIHDQLEETLSELRAQRAQTAAEIEEATVEQTRLGVEVQALEAELENLKARRAVAQTREEAKYVFDRSAFDQARDKISELRATIAEQHKRLDYYHRVGGARKGLIPADDVEAVTEESGVAAIESVLGPTEATPERAPAFQAIQR